MATRYRTFQLPLRIAVIGLMGMACGTVLAAPRSGRNQAKGDAQRRPEADTAGRFVSGLQLTPTQARRLLPIAEKAAALHVEAYELSARLQPEMLEAFAAFAEEDRLNEGFSPAVERRTAQLSHREKTARETITAQMIEIERDASALLGPDQLEFVRDFRPGGNAAENRMAARRQFATAGSGRLDAGPDRLAEAQRELAEIQTQIHPQAGPLSRFLLHPAGAAVLCGIAGVRPSESLQQAAEVLEHGTAQYPIETRDEQRTAIQALRAEINNWNLINGLHLNQPQIERIVGVCEEAKAREQSAGGVKQRAAVTRAMVVPLERAIKAALNPGQREVLADYKPCLVPPKNLKDPVRAGQANDSTVVENWLSRARRLSGRQLADHIARAIAAQTEHLGPLSQAERRQRVGQLEKAARQAARLSDAEFELNKAELAQAIAPRDRIRELHREIAGLAHDRGLPGAVSRFMLKPQFVEQLRDRGRQLAAGVQTVSRDPRSGPQAENCDKGCAVKGKASRSAKARPETPR